MDRALRHLQALLIVASAEHTLLIGGTGDVIQPRDRIVGIGSGGNCDIVAAVDRHIVGQSPAKRAVAIAVRNRWRRQQLDAAYVQQKLADLALDDDVSRYML